MERVSVREGGYPVIVVAPHGFDDPLTDVIAEVIAEQLDCFAVINHGWQRDDKVDVNKDKANCNNIVHCYHDVVKDEFLDPLLCYVSRINRAIGINPIIFNIHGLRSLDHNHVEKTNNSIDCVIGYGQGNPNRFTCDELWINHFISCMRPQVNCVKALPASPYAAWGKQNLTQLFQSKLAQKNANIVQIEILRKWRRTKTIAKEIGKYIAKSS